ncbi:MAG: hypothetical protein RL095_2082 [Verrucomicrobiota bacterium]|jgi:ankyrin repeat protein
MPIMTHGAADPGTEEAGDSLELPGEDITFESHGVVTTFKSQCDILPIELRSRLDAGLDPNSIEDGQYLLTAAINEGSAEKVQLLLEFGATVNLTCPPVDESGRACIWSRDGDLWLPINAAARKGNAEIFKLLLDHGAVLSSSTTYAAASSGSIQVMECLESRGVDFNPTELFDVAAFNEKEEMIEFLIARGAAPSQEKLANSILFYRFLAGSAKMVQLYLRLGGDLDLGDRETQCLLAKEMTSEKLECLFRLEGGRTLLRSPDFQAFLQNNDLSGSTALHFAVEAGSLEIVDELLAHGANPGAVNHRGQTSLDLALNKKPSPENTLLIARLRELGVPENRMRDGER